MDKIKIYSWNVNGLRAVIKKGFLEWIKSSQGNIICLQEIKSTVEQLPEEAVNIGGFNSYFFPAERKGYSGTAIYSAIRPVNVFYGFENPIYDVVGRVIIAEYDKYVLASV